MKRHRYLGIDIGGTRSAALVADAEGGILGREEFPTRVGSGGWKTTVDELQRASAALVREHPVEAIGISCGGPLDSVAGTILSPPNLPGWDEVPIARIFHEAFGVPAYLQNDANAGALAEWRFGAGRGSRNMVFLTFGTGLGAGLIHRRPQPGADRGGEHGRAARVEGEAARRARASETEREA